MIGKRRKIQSTIAVSVLTACALLFGYPFAGRPSAVPPRRIEDTRTVPAQVVAASPSANAPSVPVRAPSPPIFESDTLPTTLAEQRLALYRRMAAELDLSDESVAAVRAVV